MTRYQYCEYCAKRVPAEGNHTCRPKPATEIIERDSLQHVGAPSSSDLLEKLAELYWISQVPEDTLCWSGQQIQDAYLAGFRAAESRVAAPQPLTAMYNSAMGALERLRSQLSACEKERDGLRRDCENWMHKAKNRADAEAALQSQAKALREAISEAKEYGHELDCSFRCGPAEFKCDCFMSALSPVVASPAGGE